MRKRKPTHPGAILREDVLPHLGMSVSEFARNLGYLAKHFMRYWQSGVAFLQKWRFAWARYWVMVRSSGSICKRNMTSGWQRKSFTIF